MSKCEIEINKVVAACNIEDDFNEIKRLEKLAITANENGESNWANVYRKQIKYYEFK